MRVPVYGSFEVKGQPKDGLRVGMTFALMVEPEFFNGQIVSLRSRGCRFVVKQHGDSESISLEQVKEK